MIEFMAGFLVMAIVARIFKSMDEKELIDKTRPEYRIPKFIRGNFYYIVPEKEYVELTLNHLKEKMRNEHGNKSNG